MNAFVRGGYAIRTILFDIDGTILKCNGAGRLSLESAALDVLGIKGEMGSVNFQGKTDPQILHESLLPAGLSSEQIAGAMEKIKERYIFYLNQYIMEFEVTLMPGIRELLHELRKRDGLLTGLLTGNFSAGARIKLSRFDLNDEFPFGVFGDDTPVRKEMPAIARNKIRDIYNVDVSFGDMFIIGDTVHDIACARHAGAVAISVGTGWTDEKTLLGEKPDYYFRDLSDTMNVAGVLCR
jgi:phosphoglycolate phosphatase